MNNIQLSFNSGSLVKHINRPDVNMWIVVGRTMSAHLLQSVPDLNGNYEVIRGDGQNLILIPTTMNLGKHTI